MGGQAAWITEGMATQDASSLAGVRQYKQLSALNLTHLESLRGQDVVITLSDASTRQGTVHNVDPINFTVALLKPPPPLIKGSNVPSTKAVNPVCIIPGHAVKGVEIVGGRAQALDALASGRALRGVGSWAPASPSSTGCRGSSPVSSSPAREDPRARGGVSLEFLRGYSNPAADVETVGTGARAAARAGAGVGFVGAQTTATGPEPDVVSAAGARRRVVRDALEAARMPVQEVVASNGAGETTLLVMGCVRISAPYTSDACECANEAVLTRVRALVRTAT